MWTAFALGVVLAGFAADEHWGGAMLVAKGVLGVGVAVVSDSVLSEHVEQLEEAGHVRVHEATRASRLRTSLALTSAGRAAFDAHVAELRRTTGG